MEKWNKEDRLGFCFSFETAAYIYMDIDKYSYIYKWNMGLTKMGTSICLLQMENGNSRLPFIFFIN
jgi:hypothetical protein